MTHVYDIWADFNDIDVGGQVVTHRRFARKGQIIEVGENLIAGDNEGNQCHARITDVSTDGLVKLALGLDPRREGLYSVDNDKEWPREDEQ